MFFGRFQFIFIRGIGKIPDAVLSRLGHHKNIGIHTEMLSDGILELVQKGVITNAKKSLNPGNIVTGFAVGSKRLYDFVDNNAFFRFLDISYVNNPTIIGRNSKVTAINSLIEVNSFIFNILLNVLIRFRLIYLGKL